MQEQKWDTRNGGYCSRQPFPTPGTCLLTYDPSHSRGRKVSGRVESPGSKILPTFFLQDSAVEFVVPEHLQRLTLGIVVRAGEPDARCLAGSGGWYDFLDQPAA